MDKVQLSHYSKNQGVDTNLSLLLFHPIFLNSRATNLFLILFPSNFFLQNS